MHDVSLYRISHKMKDCWHL